MKSDASAGRQHPMELKKALAQRIVQDFHSADAARTAEENWSKQFQKDEVPENVEAANVSLSEVGWSISTELGAPVIGGAKEPIGVRLDKVLVKSGLASSSTEASRKIKERAVHVDGVVQESTRISVDKIPASLVIRLGKRIRRVNISQ